MRDIGHKINNAPFTVEGRRFAEEDNSVHGEMSNVILPFENLAEIREHQTFESIKGIAWLSGYALMDSSSNANHYKFLSGIVTNNEFVPLKHGMRFAFRTKEKNTTTNVKATINDYPIKDVKLDGEPVPVEWIMDEAEYMLQYDAENDWYEIVVTGCMRRLLGHPRWALWQGEWNVIFRVFDPVDDFDAVNLRTLRRAIEEIVTPPGSIDYTVPGDYIFTVPYGVTTITVLGIGGGGGGTSTNSTGSTAQWVAHPWSNHAFDWEIRYREDTDSDDCADLITDEAEVNVYFTYNNQFYYYQIYTGSRSVAEGMTTHTINGIQLRRGAYVTRSDAANCNTNTPAPEKRKKYIIETYEVQSSTSHAWNGGRAGTIMTPRNVAVDPGDQIHLTVGAGGPHLQNGTATKFNGLVFAGGVKGGQTSSTGATRTTDLGTFTRYAASGDAKGGEPGHGNGGLAGTNVIAPTGYGSGGGGYDPATLLNNNIANAAKGRNGLVRISWGN